MTSPIVVKRSKRDVLAVRAVVILMKEHGWPLEDVARVFLGDNEANMLRDWPDKTT